jgi:uncharacterized membrane protein YhaH (DUF805 family)
MELEIEPSIIYVGKINMTFFEAVGKCYRKYFIFKGRASKSEYWWFVVVAFLFAWPLLLSETKEGSWYSFLSFVYFMLTLSVLSPLMAVWTRRMHDVGKSGWTWLFIFIPIVGFVLLFRWTTKDGDAGANKYGDPDNEPFSTAIVKKSGIEDADLLS